MYKFILVHTETELFRNGNDEVMGKTIKHTYLRVNVITGSSVLVN
jgi:hypothetical protein